MRERWKCVQNVFNALLLWSVSVSQVYAYRCIQKCMHVCFALNYGQKSVVVSNFRNFQTYLLHPPVSATSTILLFSTLDFQKFRVERLIHILGLIACLRYMKLFEIYSAKTNSGKLPCPGIFKVKWRGGLARAFKLNELKCIEFCELLKEDATCRQITLSCEISL